MQDSRYYRGVSRDRSLGESWESFRGILWTRQLLLYEDLIWTFVVAVAVAVLGGSFLAQRTWNHGSTFR